MNRVILVGRITRDPELRTSPNSVSFSAFTIAVNRVAPSSTGEREADFINCVAFNKQAENLCRFIKKGGQIGVEGKLQTRRYTAQDGSNRIATEVICDNIHFLEPKSSTNGGYNDYTSYETSYMQPQQPMQQVQRQQSQGAFYQESPRQTQMPNIPVQNTQNNFYQENDRQQSQQNQFDEVKKQFDISDDDLPF